MQHLIIRSLYKAPHKNYPFYLFLDGQIFTTISKIKKTLGFFLYPQ